MLSNLLLFLFVGTPKKTEGQLIKEASRVLRAESPEPITERTVDANAGLSRFDREVLIAESQILRATPGFKQ